MKSANYGQLWLVLFCGDSYQGCGQAQSEWERAFQLVGSYCRLGRVNVDAQWSLTRSFNVRYVPSVYSVVNGEMQFYQGSIVAESLYTFVQMSTSHAFESIQSIRDWETVFNWKRRLEREVFDSQEKVTVVLYTVEKAIPLKWRYWSSKFSDTIRWYYVHSSTASKQLLETLSSQYGITRPGVAMLFSNPRDNSEVLMLADPDEKGQSVELTSSEIEEWLTANHFPVLAKMDSANFLHLTRNEYYTIAMAVDLKVGSGAAYAGNSRLRRLLKLIEPLTTLWDQRKGSNLKDLQFAWFGTQQTKLATSFGLASLPKDGQLILIDRQRFEYAILPLDIDRDDPSTFINHLLKYPQKELMMKKMLHVPQATDDQWSFSDAVASASNFSFVFVGIAIVALGAFIFIKSTPKTTSQRKPSSSTSKPSSQSSSTNSKQHESRHSQSSSSTASSSSSSESFATIRESFWVEFNIASYQDILERKNFTLVLFPRMNDTKEVKQWTREISRAFHELSTDSISLAWAHSHTQKQYVKEWIRIGNQQLDDTDAKPVTFGILLRKRGARFMVFPGDDQERALDANFLVAWVQRVLEGQTAWVDIPSDAPNLQS